MTYDFEVIIIGGGSAGLAAVEGAKEAGARRIAVIENRDLGGECPRRACVPTKALLSASKLYHAMRKDSALMGIRASGISIDLQAVMKRKDAVVSTIVGGKRLEKMLQQKGVELIRGTSAFEDAHTLRAGSRVITASAFVIATGSVDVIPDIPGLNKVDYLTYEHLVDLQKLPSSIAIIGAGPVGCEFATFFGQLGVKTYLIQAGAHILSREDEELAIIAEAQLKALGVTVLANTKTLNVKEEGKSVVITYQTGRRPRAKLKVAELALAVGKRPNTVGLALVTAGIKTDAKGRIAVNNMLHTNARHIFLAGDVSSRFLFTHTAHYEGYIAGWNAGRVLDRKSQLATDLLVVPRVTFIDPELASVGLTAKEAIDAGFSIRVLKAPMRYLGRSAVDGKREGLFKVILDQKTDLILGAHMLGERAGEVMQELALAMRSGIPFSAVQSAIRAYPTYSEIIALARE
ncbi:MAG: NAD(P)/FAD-dependent oxidoreductase [Patescibacteria group bacterium]|jgi:pyruvate/2-oxoglutarate dehydrogenase complex dihydrolipoamide dehydrogenase (E3) component